MIKLIQLELNRNLSKISLAAATLFLLTAAAILQIGIENYKMELTQKKEFQDVENLKVECYVNYVQYGIYGFQRLLVSSPLMAMFYNSTTINDLQAFIDSGVRLNFSKPQIGKNLFERPTGGILDFSWLILLPGSLFMMTWGFFTYRNRDYLHYLMGFANEVQVYGGILLGRILLTVTLLVVTTGLAFLLFTVNGIGLAAGEIRGLLLFLLTAVLAMVFFLVAGAGLGARHHRAKGIIVTAAAWIIMTLVWPELLNVTVSKNAAAHMKSRYKHEIQKIEILMEFEKLALEHARDKRYKTEAEKFESDKKFAEYWWDHKFQKVEKLEAEMVEKTAEIAGRFQLLSIINPVTFYKSVNNEISSRGYNTYLRFYKENRAIQKGFLRFYLNKRFYEKYAKVEPYLARGENMARAFPGLPRYYWPGLLLNFFHFGWGLCFSFFSFKRRVYPVTGQNAVFKGFGLHLQTGRYITLNVYDDMFIPLLLNVFWGKCRYFSGQVTLDNQNIVDCQKKAFLYLPSPDRLPGHIKTNVLVSVLAGLLKPGKEKIRDLKEKLGEDLLKKRLDKLSNREKALLMLGIAKLTQTRVYILHDLLKDMPEADKSLMMEALNDLKQSGGLTLDIISGSGVNITPDWNTQIVFRNSKYESIPVKNLMDRPGQGDGEIAGEEEPDEK